MAVSKATVLNALATFKGLQDNANAAKYVAQESGKGLISSADQSKLDGIASGAQVNLIESVTVDGVTQSVNRKNVALDMSAYVKGTEIASNLRYKSILNSYGNLPVSGQKIGDMYKIKTAGGSDTNGVAIKAGDFVFWNGTGWDLLSGNVDLSGFVQAQDGKGLSTNDFTDELKSKLETLSDTTIETITEAEIQAMFE
ncbi:MAG: hypothetical protein IJ685_04590 [Selenomonadaceae bacterium]|nr:hypothetical protein [Selenomonadaceae bacterium]